MSKTLLRHTLIKKNIFDIFVDFLIFIHFHYMKGRIISKRVLTGLTCNSSIVR